MIFLFFGLSADIGFTKALVWDTKYLRFGSNFFTVYQDPNKLFYFSQLLVNNAIIYLFVYVYSSSYYISVYLFIHLSRVFKGRSDYFHPPSSNRKSSGPANRQDHLLFCYFYLLSTSVSTFLLLLFTFHQCIYFFVNFIHVPPVYLLFRCFYSRSTNVSTFSSLLFTFHQCIYFFVTFIYFLPVYPPFCYFYLLSTSVSTFLLHLSTFYQCIYFFVRYFIHVPPVYLLFC